MRLDSFQKAIEAAEAYLAVALESRGNIPVQYELLALSYLTYRDGKRPGNQAIYESQIHRRLGGRKPTGPENKRPFLLLLHALFNDDELDQSMQRRISKMTTGLEKIDTEFKIRSLPSADQIVEFIQESGGIDGLWAKARPTYATGSRQYSKVRHNLTNVEGCVVKNKRGHALHLNLEPGEYTLRIEVSSTGRVQVKNTRKA